MTLPLNKALLEIAVLYTKNSLPYGVAYHLMCQAMSEWENNHQAGHSPQEVKHKAAVKFLGESYMSDYESLLTQEIGYNGNVYEWFMLGNRPKCWDMTRKEYQLACSALTTDPTPSTTKTAATDADVTCSAPEKV